MGKTVNIAKLRISEISKKIRENGHLKERTDFVIDDIYQTNEQMVWVIEKVLLPVLGDVKVEDIDNFDFTKYVKRLYMFD